MKRRVLGIFLSLCMIVSLLPSVSITAAAEEAHFDGNGTEAVPYFISDEDDLRLLANNVNNGTNYSGIYFRLNADIALGLWLDSNDTGTAGVIDDGEICNAAENSTAFAASNWAPIGTSDKPFKGVFDGNRHKISGVYIKSSDFYQGLFGYIDGGTVKDLGITDSYISGNLYTGGIAGISYNGVIVNCYNMSSVSGSSDIGGIVGKNDSGDVTGCYNSGRISGSQYYIGGIAGGNYGTVHGCVNTGFISGVQAVGGIAGMSLGDKESCFINSCYNGGDIRGGDIAGGITGLNRGSFNDSIAELCYNEGSVSGGDRVGGIAGKNDAQYSGSGIIQYCYSNGYVSGTSSVGGVTGLNEMTVLYSFYDRDICSSASLSDLVSGKTTAEMIGESLISEGWTDTDWIFADNEYPKLAGLNYNYDAPAPAVSGVTVTGALKSGETLTGVYEGVNASDTYKWYAASSESGDGMDVISGANDISFTITADCITKFIAFEVTPDDGLKTGPAQMSGWFGPVQAASPYSGSGTSDEPYLIEDADDLNRLAADVNGGTAYNNTYFLLAADIALGYWQDDGDGVIDDGEICNSEGDMYTENNWTPIGTSENPFSGIFDGDSKTISGIYIIDSEDYRGVFGYVVNGTVINLNVTDSYIRDSDYVGGIIGNCSGSLIQNCRNGASVSGSLYAGGICGRSDDSNILDCRNDGYITGRYMHTGGIVGQFDSTAETDLIKDCLNTGTVDGYNKTGGLVGNLENGVFEYNRNTGTVSGSDANTGGLAGNMADGTMQCSYNAGLISGKSLVGGLVGNIGGGAVQYCHNGGDVSGSGSNIGGLLGYYYDGTAEYCYNAGTVGGLSYLGGLAGNRRTTNQAFTQCYYDRDLCSVGGVNGNITVGKTTAEMKGTGLRTAASGEGWSETYWVFTDNNYPRLVGMLYEDINTPPVASDVSISGTVRVGEELTGNYAFADAEDGEESGSEYQWYTAEDINGTGKAEIDGARDKAYTIDPAYGGKCIAFEVTPCDGTDFGDPVISGWYEVSNAEQDAPTGLTGEKPTSAANDDGQITGVDDTMEYRLSSAGVYTPVPAGTTEVSGLIPGTYYVRYAAKTGYNASPDTEVTIPEYDYKIIYNGNGGDGSIPVDTVKYGENEEAIILGAVGLTKEGYSFAGWNTAADGSDVNYGTGQRVTMTGSLTLYAQWVNINTVTYKYYKGHAYAVIDRSMCWTDADKLCTDLGGYLAEITTAEENGFVTDLISDYGDKSWYWLGGTDIDEEGVWKWLSGETWWDGGEIIDKYSNWNSTEPSNNGDEDYLVIYTKGLDDIYPAGTWNDYDNYAVSDHTGISYLGLVCEIDNPETVEYRVTYDGNGSDGGTVPADGTVYDGTENTTILGAGNLLKTGCAFKGWNTEPDGTGVYYSAGASVRLERDIKLYADWAYLSVTIAGFDTVNNRVSVGYSCAESSLLATAVYDSTGKMSDIKLTEAAADEVLAEIQLSRAPASGSVIKAFLLKKSGHAVLCKSDTWNISHAAANDWSLRGVFAAQKLTLAGSGDYPPYNYLENGRITGFEVDVGREIAFRLGVRLDYQVSEWSGLIDELNGGAYDGILASMTITEERKKLADFTIPYYYSGAQLEEEQGIAVKKGNNVLLNKLNTILQDMYSDGTMAKISTKWFDGADITVR